eukprot:CAMPEP_0194330958 /NCGR_PEP_ID=MMETSP0171-20130528/53855_1 /TAXON_ID=218684 /ORGANISM="Corethron pennatum, Strain L29A3" /LENGTH=106 /DNA_ID=CAMNT_0039092221 /DNA_START=21 /DNA_END=341 /DNA_ORIENTATION=-
MEQEQAFDTSCWIKECSICEDKQRTDLKLHQQIHSIAKITLSCILGPSPSSSSSSTYSSTLARLANLPASSSFSATSSSIRRRSRRSTSPSLTPISTSAGMLCRSM